MAIFVLGFRSFRGGLGGRGARGGGGGRGGLEGFGEAAAACFFFREGGKREREKEAFRPMRLASPELPF